MRRRGMGKRRGRKVQDVDPRFSPFGISYVFGGNKGCTRVKKTPRGRGHARITLYPRPDTHVLSRSPGSRDERALRASLKAAPDSKPRPSPATLAPGPPLLFPSHLLSHSSPSWYFSRSFSSTCHLLTSPFFSFRLSPVEFYLSLAVSTLLRIFVSRLSSSFLTPSFARELPPEMLSSSTYAQFRLTRSCFSMTARIGRWPIFLNAIADKLF